LPVWTGVAVNEFLKVIGNGVALDIAAGLNFACDFLRDVPRPVLKGVEGDNANRIVELAPT